MNGNEKKENAIDIIANTLKNTKDVEATDSPYWLIIDPACWTKY